MQGVASVAIAHVRWGSHCLYPGCRDRFRWGWLLGEARAGGRRGGGEGRVGSVKHTLLIVLLLGPAAG